MKEENFLTSQPEMPCADFIACLLVNKRIGAKVINRRLEQASKLLQSLLGSEPTDLTGCSYSHRDGQLEEGGSKAGRLLCIPDRGQLASASLCV